MADRKPLSSGVVVGRLAGIPIRVHPTFLILVGLALAGGFGRPVDGLIWIAMVFASIVTHELAHSLVARRIGITVRDIVLLPIGGMSEMERLPENPRHEGAIALAGPLSSIGLSAALAMVTVVSGGTFAHVTLDAGALLPRAAMINAVLAAFNLLPAFPMDGGRVLRAALTQRVGLDRATRLAGAIGRSLAGVMAIAGMLWMPWLLLIAVFVYIGSRSEQAATLLHVRLGGVLARDVAVHPVAVPPSTPLTSVLMLRRTYGQRFVPVVDDGRCVGIIDTAALVAGQGTFTARQAATPVPEVAADMPVDDALAVIGSVGAGAVVDGGRYEGLLFADDVVHLARL